MSAGREARTESGDGAGAPGAPIGALRTGRSPSSSSSSRSWSWSWSPTVLVVVGLVVALVLSVVVVGAPAAGARGVTASVVPPVITSVAPVAGSVAGGNQVFVNGSGFAGATAVRFGGTNAAFFAVWGDGLIVALAPAHAAGAVDVAVTTAAGTSASGPSSVFTFAAAANGGIQGSVRTEDHASAAGMLAVAVDPATQAIVAIGLVQGDGTFGFTALAPGSYYVAVIGNASYKTKLAGFAFDPTAAALGPATTFTVTSGATTVLDPMDLWRVTPKPSTPFDFTGDGKADVVWVDNMTGDWFQSATPVAPDYVDRTKLATIYALPQAGDYDGDGRFEPAGIVGTNWVTAGARGTIAFARPTTTTGTAEAVPGMYDGNRTTQPAFYRTEDATWFIEGHAPTQFGSGPSAPGGTSAVGKIDFDRPVPADYDGDGRTDLAVWNPRSSVWKIRRSTDGAIITKTFGGPYMYPAPQDYDGDGRAEPAFQTSTGFLIDGVAVPPDGFGAFGMSSTMPAPADYDGDGRADRAVADTVHNSYLTMKLWGATGIGGARMSTPGTSNPLAVAGTMSRYGETAALTTIWKCVANAALC